MGTSRGAVTALPTVQLLYVAALLVLIVPAISIARAQELTTDFYDKSCPSIYSIVSQQGCDGSLLLDDAPGITTEKNVGANLNSTRGYEVGLTVTYPVYFGCRDSLTTNASLVTEFLPRPEMKYTALNENFTNVGLNETDLIALSGAHTIGRVRCEIVTGSSLNDTNINAEFRIALAAACDPATVDPFTLQNLDLKTPDKFDNNYFKNLRRAEGILPSDQTLQSTPGSNVAIVKDYAKNKENFFRDFGLSSIKMGIINPLTGNQGEIRKSCRVINPALPSLELLPTGLERVIAYE